MIRASEKSKLLAFLIFIILLIGVFFSFKYKQGKEIVSNAENNKEKIIDKRSIGEEYTYVLAVSGECVSCHSKTIFVLNKEGKKVFEIIADDPLFNFSTEDSFSFIEPIRKEGEPLCCPTAHKTRIFKWNGEVFNEVKTNSL